MKSSIIKAYLTAWNSLSFIILYGTILMIINAVRFSRPSHLFIITTLLFLSIIIHGMPKYIEKYKEESEKTQKSNILYFIIPGSTSLIFIGTGQIIQTNIIITIITLIMSYSARYLFDKYLEKILEKIQKQNLQRQRVQ